MADDLPYRSVVIVGAGFAGLAMGAQLDRKLGFRDYVLYEQSASLGGTWWSNSYPGCGVDIPFPLYSLSFAPNLKYSKWYPERSEILQYMRDIAQKYDVESRIILNVTVKTAWWQGESKTWKLQLKDLVTGQTLTQSSKVLISAAGTFVQPTTANIEGLEDFEGPVLHTAKWNNDVVLQGKNVAVVGNGSSATQLIPQILSKVNSLHHFVRSPQYYVRRLDPKINGTWRYAVEHVPLLFSLIRCLLFHMLEYTFISYRTDLEQGARARARNSAASERYVRATAPEEYWLYLRPAYPLGCKRTILDSQYLTALHEEKMHMVPDPIRRIENGTIITKAEGRYHADVVILATGFETTRSSFLISGRDGITLDEHWARSGGRAAYKSVSVAGFPNLFLLNGPNSVCAHSSALASIENHVDLILKVAKPVILQVKTMVEVKSGYEKRYSKQIREALKSRVWQGCRSYYQDEVGNNFLLYPWHGYTMYFQTHFESLAAWDYR